MAYSPSDMLPCLHLLGSLGCSYPNSSLTEMRRCALLYYPLPRLELRTYSTPNKEHLLTKNIVTLSSEGRFVQIYECVEKLLTWFGAQTDKQCILLELWPH